MTLMWLESGGASPASGTRCGTASHARPCCRNATQHPSISLATNLPVDDSPNLRYIPSHANTSAY